MTGLHPTTTPPPPPPHHLHPPPPALPSSTGETLKLKFAGRQCIKGKPNDDGGGGVMESRKNDGSQGRRAREVNKRRWGEGLGEMTAINRGGVSGGH